MVPLANMFGYVNTLRSMSQGRAQYTMQFDHYSQVPQAVADEVQAKLRLNDIRDYSDTKSQRRELDGEGEV